MGNPELSDCGIEDEEIELYALDRVRVPDPKLVAHFKTCASCTARMESARIWAAEIKRILAEQIGGPIALGTAASKPNS